MRNPVSQACDACRRRKIKCNGLQPCPNCSAASLACTYKVEQKRGGNRGARATTLNELRGAHSGESESLQSPKPPATQNQSFSPESRSLETIPVHVCIDAYFAHIHPVVPFLNQEILEYEREQASASPLSRLFIAAFCAYVVTFGNVLGGLFGVPTSGFNANLGKQLLGTALQLLAPERTSSPTCQSVFISFFLYSAFAGLGNYRQGWYYLREATTLFMMRGDEGIESVYTPAVCGRLFWVMFISERAHAIRRNRPITLQITSASPPLDGQVAYGLQCLVTLFRPFDEAFFAVWNGSHQECSREWLLDLERQIRSTLPTILDLSSEQVTNLRVSQLWLQIKLWELFPRFGFLSSESVHECLTFRYPVGVARDLTVLGMKLPIGSLQVHGMGMTEKVFDIACALIDILPFVSTKTSQFELSPVDYLNQITALLAKLPGGSSKFGPLLLLKINEMLPELVVPLCQAAKLPIPTSESPLSPASRCVYEEELRGNLYADLRRGGGDGE